MQKFMYQHHSQIQNAVDSNRYLWNFLTLLESARALGFSKPAPPPLHKQ